LVVTLHEEISNADANVKMSVNDAVDAYGRDRV
jgi:hypothetical protein